MEKIYESNELIILFDRKEQQIEMSFISDKTNLIKVVPFYDFKDIVAKMNLLLKIYSNSIELENYNSEI